MWIQGQYAIRVCSAIKQGGRPLRVGTNFVVPAEALNPLRFYESALAIAKAYQESHGVMPSDPSAEVRDLRKQAKARAQAGQAEQPGVDVAEDNDEVSHHPSTKLAFTLNMFTVHHSAFQRRALPCQGGPTPLLIICMQACAHTITLQQ